MSDLCRMNAMRLALLAFGTYVHGSVLQSFSFSCCQKFSHGCCAPGGGVELSAENFLFLADQDTTVRHYRTSRSFLPSVHSLLYHNEVVVYDNDAIRPSYRLRCL